MSEFGAHWERKLRTFFKKIDADGDGVLTIKDFNKISDNVIKAGHFTGAEADEIRANYMKLWNKYYNRGQEEDTTTCDVFLKNLKSQGKNEILAVCDEQCGVMFDTVDTNKDGSIQLTEFIVYFSALGISEELAREAFKALDTDGNGVLSREEFITAGKGFYTFEEPSLPADLFYGSM